MSTMGQPADPLGPPTPDGWVPIPCDAAPRGDPACAADIDLTAATEDPPAITARRLPARPPIGGSAPFANVLAGAQAGEEWAWRSIYTALAPQVRGYLRSRGAREPDDLLGEVFVQLSGGISRFAGRESQFRSWVFMVAHNRVVDEHRRRSRRPVHEGPEPIQGLADDADTEGEVLASAATTEVLELLAILTADQRAVLELRFLGGLTIDEIAVVVEKPAGAVKALQRRALAALRRELARSGVSR
ncbi:hypothetical protein BH20ACT2_BH20ACT2_24390 [soil metagenome]